MANHKQKSQGDMNLLGDIRRKWLNEQIDGEIAIHGDYRF